MTDSSTSPYSRMVLVSEEEFRSMMERGNSPTDGVTDLAQITSGVVGPDQQYRVKAVQLHEKKIKNENMEERGMQLDQGKPYSSGLSSNLIDRLSTGITESKIPKSIALLTFLKNKFPAVSWDENDELKQDGEPLPGSNVVELIHYAAHDSRKGPAIPVGWEKFKEILRQLNVPKSHISKATVMELGLERRQRRPASHSPPVPPAHQQRAHRRQRGRPREREAVWIEE